MSALTVEQPEIDYKRIMEILMPSAMAAQDRVAAGTRFVHYTSAQSALEILKSKCMWMRNVTCMNDYNEMKHGLKCLVEALQTETGESFKTALDQCYDGLYQEIFEKLANVSPSLMGHTYITCVSEHSDDEELYGRLSMWRSYGSSTGAAIVFNNGPFLRPSNALQVWTTPVNYVDENGFRDQIQNVSDQIIIERALLTRLSREELSDAIFRTLIFSVISSKHKGFHEEKEWRIVHCPTLWPSPPDRIPLDQVSLGGIPQPIFKIPFKDYPDEGFFGATIPDLINHIIVGPTPYPEASQTAFAQVLAGAGVENAISRVHCSEVSLRV